MNSDQVTRDLATKAADDVAAALRRTMAISPMQMPVIMCACSALIGILTAEVSKVFRYRTDKPDPQAIMLAALMVARAGGDKAGDAVELAKGDLAVLKSAGRI